MTRSQRIALAMYAPFWTAVRREVAVAQVSAHNRAWLGLFHRLGCYDAMDDLDPYQDVNPSESIVFVRGNRGMPCS